MCEGPLGEAAQASRLGPCSEGGSLASWLPWVGSVLSVVGQAQGCVGPGKSNLPFELRRKAGDCSRVTAGPIDLI